MSRANRVVVIALNSWCEIGPASFTVAETAIHAQRLITHPESHLWCSGERGGDESRGHTELECLFYRMPTEMRQTSRNKEAVRHYSFQSNSTSQGRWFIMVITHRLTLAGEQRAVPEIIIEHRCQIWPVMAMMSCFALLILYGKWGALNWMNDLSMEKCKIDRLMQSIVRGQ